MAKCMQKICSEQRYRIRKMMSGKDCLEERKQKPSLIDTAVRAFWRNGQNGTWFCLAISQIAYQIPD